MARDSPKMAPRWPIWAQHGPRKFPDGINLDLSGCRHGSCNPLPSCFLFVEALIYFLLGWNLLRIAKSWFFPVSFYVLGPCWAFLGVRKQLPSTFSLSVSGVQPLPPGLQLVTVKALQELRGHFASSCVSLGLQDGLGQLHDGLQIAKHGL